MSGLFAAMGNALWAMPLILAAVAVAVAGFTLYETRGGRRQ